MNWNLFAIFLSLLIIITLVILRYRSNRKRGKDACYQAILTVVATFLGVFGALYFTDIQQTYQTKENLKKVAKEDGAWPEYPPDDDKEPSGDIQKADSKSVNKIEMREPDEVGAEDMCEHDMNSRAVMMIA